MKKHFRYPESRALGRAEQGQAMIEYAIITAAFFGFSVMGWPFLTQLINALNTYFHSIYYIIQSPVP